MSLDLMKEKGIPLENQKFDWYDLVRVPTSKLDDDAFTLMNGIESEALRFQHACARMNKQLQLELAVAAERDCDGCRGRRRLQGAFE